MKVILFDGVCNLGNSMVRFVIKNGKKIFQFAPSNSNYSIHFLKTKDIDDTDLSK